MALAHSPSIVTNGLILALDASNRKSYIGSVQTSLINTNSWTVSSGSVDGYGQNGNTGENTRLYDTDPWGNQSLVWGTFASGDGNADGGWNTNYPSIDPTKLYRFSVWVRRTSSTSGGTFYFGTGAGGGEVRGTSDSATKGNPYWECQGTGVLTQNQWYLVCGHVYPHTTTYTGRHPDTGYFTVAGGATKVMSVNGCNIGSDLKWDAASNSAVHRTYHYYCGDSTTRLQFMAPRIDLCDGTEPTISELLKNGTSVWKDLSGNNNHATLINSPTYSNGVLQFNGTNYARVTSVNLASGASTVMGATRYSGGTRGRMITAVNNNWLMGYWSSSTENYYAEGWVSSPSTGASDTNWRILTATGNTSTDNWQLFVNGVLTQSNSGGSQGPNGIQVPQGGGEQSTGECGFILAYNRVLTDAEIKQNFNALRRRYAL
jgi:hypothetical protein